MDLALRTDGNMLEKVTVALTRRDIALIDICLGLVAQNHARGGNLRSDIESLQTRLAQYHSGPSILREKQAGCGEECQCQRLST